MKRKLLVASVLIILSILAILVLRRTAEAPDTSLVPSADNNVVFNRNQYPVDDPGSLWYIVNKKKALPAGYIPIDLVNVEDNKQLRNDASLALENLISTAGEQAIDLKLVSAYRSYQYQTEVYNNYVQKDGQPAADTYSARPGHSEHQTGLAADLGNSNGACDLAVCFAGTPGGKWLAEHAHEYGFIIRYKEGKENVTGFQYEPWHLRYVGKELAGELRKTNKTMEEYFGVAGGGY